MISKFLNTPFKINLLLFLCSLGIYTFYFHHVFFNINSILAGITGDALKNYFTYAYHIKNDEGILHFTGMNFPFGEHVVFTDCQPILTFVLRVLPFTHPYLIGILHTLLFMSYILTPLILNKILLRFELDKFSSFFISLAITLLSPQFAKISGGHHALAYGCAIPLSILFILNFIQKSSTRNLLTLFFYNFALFFLHPYMGFSTSIFCFLALTCYTLFKWERSSLFKDLLKILFAGLLPLLLFQLFMKLTDLHPNRTVEPHGSKTLIENIQSLLAPDFGPFKIVLENLFPGKTTHLEGHSYLGLSIILLTVCFVLSLLFFFKRIRIKKEMAAILISSLFLLFISFGWHIYILDLFHVKSPALNQFRATSRFAWFFYYSFPLFIIPCLYHIFKTFTLQGRFLYIFPTVSILFLSINLWEANYYFKKDEANFWKFRNILNEKFLNAEEIKMIAHIRSLKTQAILPFPIFALGSEMYDRIGADFSMIPSMLYSYHTGVPIISGAMSRTSISETEEFIELLNSYKKKNPGIDRLTDQPIFVIKTKDPLLPDEDRLLTSVNFFAKNDSLAFGEITKKDLRKRKLDAVTFNADQRVEADSNNVVYIPTENRKPFISSSMEDYQTIYILDSTKIKSGTYIVGFHFHYTRKIYTSLDLTLIVTKGKGADYAWQNFQRISILSGFYPGFAVLEYKVDLEKDSRYEFILKGLGEQTYHISHFMLRPEHKSVITKENRDTLFNNFPD